MTSPLSIAADSLVADADTLDATAIRHMAHEMMQAYGCTYSAAKSAIVRAIKRRADGTATTWGGSRGGGRPPKVEEVSE